MLRRLLLLALCAQVCAPTSAPPAPVGVGVVAGAGVVGGGGAFSVSASSGATSPVPGAGAVALAGAAPAAPFVPRLPCPFSLPPVESANKAAAELVPEGRIEEALMCMHEATAAAQAARLPEETLEVMKGNAQVLSLTLAPHSHQNRRLHHNTGGETIDFPHSDTPLAKRSASADAIGVYDGALSEAQCAAIISLFERSELFQGNLLSNGKVVMRPEHKKVMEFDISGTPGNPEWAAVDRMATQVMIKHLHLYEAEHPAVRMLRNPLGDEGWRMKRYVDDGTEHHAYHADGGHELPGAPGRVIAVLIYLSEPEEGGETVFFNHGVAVKPRCGRVLMFPTSFTHVHAGRRVRKGRKYALSLMITA